jgi:hypothetical protein
VFDPVAVRAQDNALGNLPHYRLAGEAATNHIGDIKVFFLVVGVVELKGSVDGEPTARIEGSSCIRQATTAVRCGVDWFSLACSAYISDDDRPCH